MAMNYENIANLVLERLKLPDTEDVSRGHLTMDNWEWPTGVALYGVWKTYKKTGDKNILDYLESWYARRFTMEKPHRNVNTVAPMLALTFMYEETKNEEYLPHILSWAEWVMNEMPRTELGGLQHCTVWNRHYEQLWDDTLFMTVLFLLKAGLVLGNKEWVEEAGYQFLIHIRYLQDKITGLWYHGWTFDRRHNFAEAFWGRGNAWAVMSSVEFVEMVGRDSAVARYVLACLNDQVLALWKLQRENGMFTTLLDVEETYLETSCTAGIACGVLKGIRLGYIDEKYRDMGMKAAAAVIERIAEDGTVQGVSNGTGMGHTLDFYKNISITPTAYGQGIAFLMLTELCEGEEG